MNSSHTLVSALLFIATFTISNFLKVDEAVGGTRVIPVSILVFTDDPELRVTFPMHFLINALGNREFAQACQTDQNRITVTNAADKSTYHIVYFNECMAQLMVEDLNIEFSKILPNWGRFELASFRIVYDQAHAKPADAHKALEALAKSSFGKFGHLNLFLADLESRHSGTSYLVGTTYLRQSIYGNHGAIVLLNGGEGRQGFRHVHEVAHVVGINHVAGYWPPVTHVFTRADGSEISYSTLSEADCEWNIMGTWFDDKNCDSVKVFNQKLGRLIMPPLTLATDRYRRVFGEIFDAWLSEQQPPQGKQGVAVRMLKAGDNAFSFSWQSAEGELYRLQFKTHLNELEWTDMGSPMSGIGTNLITITNAYAASQRFFRIVTLPQSSD